VSLLVLLPLALVSTQALAQDEAGTPVITDIVREQPIQQVLQLTGSVTSARSSSLSASTAGLVTAMHVDAGSEVTAGELLLELDPGLARWQWQSAQASAESARIAVADAKRRLEEARALAPQMSIAETAVRDLEAELAQDTAQLQVADAEAGYRKGVLDRHQMRAPFSGVVSRKSTELGEWVNPGQPVLTLVATRELRIDFRMAEDYLANVEINSPVTYTLGDDSGDARAAKIATAVPVTDPGSRTFLLRIQPDEPDSRMVAGMSARAQLTLHTDRRGLTIPRDAILKFPDGRAITWVVTAGQEGPVAKETPVKTGAAFNGMIEILSGLEAGAQIVVRGNEGLTNGQRVAVISGKSR
jgi:RND family efflux transporter MFP subunit